MIIIDVEKTNIYGIEVVTETKTIDMGWEGIFGELRYLIDLNLSNKICKWVYIASFLLFLNLGRGISL